MKKKAVRLTTILAAAALSASAFGCAAAPAAQPAAEEAPAETAEEAPAEAEEETAEEAEVTAEEAETEEAAAEETAETTRIFTDSAGREVEVDAEITRIAATGPLAQIALYAIAPDLMVGWTSDWSEA